MWQWKYNWSSTSFESGTSGTLCFSASFLEINVAYDFPRAMTLLFVGTLANDIVYGWYIQSWSWYSLKHLPFNNYTTSFMPRVFNFLDSSVRTALYCITSFIAEQCFLSTVLVAPVTTWYARLSPLRSDAHLWSSAFSSVSDYATVITRVILLAFQERSYAVRRQQCFHSQFDNQNHYSQHMVGGT